MCICALLFGGSVWLATSRQAAPNCRHRARCLILSPPSALIDLGSFAKVGDRIEACVVAAALTNCIDWAERDGSDTEPELLEDRSHSAHVRGRVVRVPEVSHVSWSSRCDHSVSLFAQN